MRNKAKSNSTTSRLIPKLSDIDQRNFLLITNDSGRDLLIQIFDFTGLSWGINRCMI